MAKRGAVKELTHENWADEEEPEEMGMFRQASSEQLAGRQIKKARRRAVASEDSTSGVFKGFTSFAGFGGNKDSSSQPSFSFLSGDATTKPTFDILNTAKTNTTTSCSTKSEVGSPEKKASTQLFKVTKESLAGAPKEAESIKTNGVGPAKVKADSSGRGGNKVFLSHLKALNEGVVLWVKQHLDTNPHINLSPVFDDYKKHFEELSKKYPAVSDNESDLETIATTACNKDNASEKENQPVPVKSNFSFSGSVSSSSEKPSFSFSLGSATEKKSSDSPTKPSFSFGDFGKKSPEKSIFSSKSGIFGGMDSSALGSTSTTTSTTTTTTATTTITTAKPETEQNPDEASDEPPKVEVTEVKEDDAIYEKKCKLFYMKDGAYVEKGVGTLFLKPAGEKTQLLVRALTNLGNILLNIILNPTVPTARMGKNSVLIVCVPNPPLSTNSESSEPVKMLIRVKTGEDADALHEKINELKK